MTGRRRSLWADLGWPVLAGMVAATGLASAYLSLGWSTTAFVFAFTVVMVAILTVSLLEGRGRPTVVSLVSPALYAGVTMVVTMGLIAWMHAWAFLVVGLVVVGNGAVRRKVRRVLGASPPAPDDTRRRFDEIVAHELAGLDDDDR